MALISQIHASDHNKWICNQSDFLSTGPDADGRRWMQITGISKFWENLCSIASEWSGYCKWEARTHFYQLIVLGGTIWLWRIWISCSLNKYFWPSLTKGQPRPVCSSGLLSAVVKRKPNFGGRDQVSKSYGCLPTLGKEESERWICCWDWANIWDFVPKRRRLCRGISHVLGQISIGV